ncbi:hypothetical protein FEF22_000510 [Texas Phoenix palm phytoplasma]|uniref:Effector n=1 Tax=Texas Phoenix palm phytoplasma TaxID=176709 RepID=A0ABS5BI65_9MOLU|nr:hypothetical protein [Texas Phoenix palm phytoplasma]MBP3059270.1 hypothetical protein [Texas Phoenix palm phytoplasma]
MLERKNIFINKKIVYCFYFLIIILSFFFTVAFSLMNFFHKEKQFSKNFKIGKSTGELLIVDCKADSTTKKNELLSLNDPFINDEQQTYTIEETHIVKLDSNQTKNKAVDLLNKYKWLSINYKIFLLAKNNNSNDDLMLISTKKGQDITTSIYDEKSNSEKESSIFPTLLSYSKVDNSSNNKQPYVDASGKLQRPEMLKKSASNANDEYFSYEVLIQIQSNITLNKENLKDFFDSYNRHNHTKRRSYSEFASDYDTPSIKIIVEYDLVDENGREHSAKSSRKGSLGMKLPTQETHVDSKKGEKILVKIVNLEQNRNVQTNTISN